MGGGGPSKTQTSPPRRSSRWWSKVPKPEGPDRRGPVIGCSGVCVQAAQPVRLNVLGTRGDHFHGPSVSLAAHTTKKDPGWC